jgi:hypothetical protein
MLLGPLQRRRLRIDAVRERVELAERSPGRGVVRHDCHDRGYVASAISAHAADDHD